MVAKLALSPIMKHMIMNLFGVMMENNQTEPDIKVKNMPGFIDKGVDQQLQKAVEELLNE